MRYTPLAVAACLLAGVAGCGPTPSSGGTKASAPAGAPTLAGKWEGAIPRPEVKAKVTFVFTEAGQYVRATELDQGATGPEVGDKQAGRYTLADKALTLTADGRETKLTVKELTADKLVLTDADGKDTTLTRVK